MKTGSIIAIAAAAVGVWRLASKKKQQNNHNQYGGWGSDIKERIVKIQYTSPNIVGDYTVYVWYADGRTEQWALSQDALSDLISEWEPKGAEIVKPSNTLQVISGIGDLTAWNKRQLDNFFDRNMYGDKVIVYKNYRDDRGYIPVDFIYGGYDYAGNSCVISPNNIEYLKKLCSIYNCRYTESSDSPGYIPNIHKI